MNKYETLKSIVDQLEAYLPVQAVPMLLTKEQAKGYEAAIRRAIAIVKSSDENFMFRYQNHMSEDINQ